MQKVAMLAALMLAAGGPALASGSADASGQYAGEASSFALSHVVVLRQDDAEHVREGGPGLRVLLSDAEVPVDAIEGGAFPPVLALAADKRLHGLMFDLDPARPDRVEVRVLDAGADSSASITLANSAGLWKTLAVANGRITAELKPASEMSFRFSAPIADDAVREDLRGASARAHPLAAMAVRQAEALGRGDLSAAAAYSSARRKAEIAAMPPPMRRAMMHQSDGMLATARATNRLVIRGNVATALGPDGVTASFVREDGAWKID